MDGWMDGCMDAWMHGCMDAWMHGCMDAWMHGCMDAWMHGCMDAWMHGWMDAWMHGCMDAWMHGCMDAWMHGCMDAWMHGCMDAWYVRQDARLPGVPCDPPTWQLRAIAHGLRTGTFMGAFTASGFSLAYLSTEERCAKTCGCPNKLKASSCCCIFCQLQPCMVCFMMFQVTSGWAQQPQPPVEAATPTTGMSASDGLKSGDDDATGDFAFQS